MDSSSSYSDSSSSSAVDSNSSSAVDISSSSVVDISSSSSYSDTSNSVSTIVVDYSTRNIKDVPFIDYTVTEGLLAVLCVLAFLRLIFRR